MTDPSIVAKLEELLAAIGAFDDPRRASDQWKQAYKLLQKTDLSKVSVTNITAGRDVKRFAELIDQLRSAGAPPAADAPDAETCRRAIKAFKKRQTLTQLDEESALGHSPLSKEHSRRKTAIEPPIEWPHSVWQELVRQGRLRDIGHGLYELVEEPPKPEM